MKTLSLFLFMFLCQISTGQDSIPKIIYIFGLSEDSLCSPIYKASIISDLYEYEEKCANDSVKVIMYKYFIAGFGRAFTDKYFDPNTVHYRGVQSKYLGKMIYWEPVKRKPTLDGFIKFIHEKYE